MSRSFVAATFTAASVLLLVGCSGSSTAGSSPSSAVSTATTQQYASVIAPITAEAKTKTAALDGCSGPQPLSCKLSALDASWTAENFISKYGLYFDPASKGYLGDPPAEIAPLAGETKAAAERVVDKCNSEKSNVDSSAFSACKAAAGGFVSALTRWQPYGG